MTIQLFFNILAAVSVSVFTGMLLTIGTTLGAYWKKLSPFDFLAWFSENIHLVVRMIPIYLFAILFGFIGSLWIGWSDIGQRYLWGAALACIFFLLVITAVYNGPMNSRFIAKSISVDQVPAALNKWLTFHYVRVVLALAASILSIIAVNR